MTKSYGKKTGKMMKSIARKKFPKRKPNVVLDNTGRRTDHRSSSNTKVGIRPMEGAKITKTTMPVSKKAMSTMTKGPKPKLKPTSRIKKIKNKETKRKKKQIVKYYKNKN